MRTRVGIAVAVLGLVGAAWALSRRSSTPVDPERAGGAPTASAEGRALAAAPRGAAPAPVGARGVTVHGVVTEGGVPVAARVEVYREIVADGTWDVLVERRRGPDALERVAAVVADADGRYEVTGLPVATCHVVGTTPSARGSTAVSARAEGERFRADLALAVGVHVVDVTCRHADGRPWRPVVRLRWRDETPRRADEQGSVRFERIASVAVEVVAADGDLELSAQVELPAQDPVVLTHPGARVAVVGRVESLLDGTPLAGAGVTVEGAIGAASLRVVTVTDERGAFRLEALPTGPALVVGAAGHADARVALGPRGEPLVVRLRPLSRLAGTVVDAATRRPVAGVRVLVGRIDDPSVFRLRTHVVGPLVATAESDAAGRFAVAVDAVGPVRVGAIGAGGISAGLADRDRSPLPIVALSARAPATVVVEVSPAARVEGTVRDADGRPVAGAAVFASRDDRHDGVRGVPEEDDGALPAVSGPDGRYVLSAVLPAVRVLVRASSDAVRSPPAAVGPLDPGATATVDLTVPRLRRVTFEVSGPRGPMSGVSLAVAHGDGGAHEVTDSTGRATLLLAEGARVTVWASASGAWETVEVDVPASASGDDDAFVVPFALRRASSEEPAASGGPVRRRGVVRFPDGSAAVGAWAVACADADGVEGEELPWNWRRVHADATGAFDVEVLDGDLVLCVGATRDGVEWRAERPRGADEDLGAIVLAPRASGSGRRLRVLDAEGRRVASAVVDVRYDGADDDPRSSFVDGVLRLPRDGVVSMVLRDARGEDGEQAAGAALVVGPVRVAELPDPLRLPAERAVEGRVRSADGRPVVGVEVRAWWLRRDRATVEDVVPHGRVLAFGRGALVARAYADADGRFVLRALPADAPVVVGPDLADVWVDEDLDVVVAPDEREVSFVLRPAVVVPVTVVDGEGRPVGGARVFRALETSTENGDPDGTDFAWSDRSLHDDSISERWTGSDGVTRVAGLDPERAYSLFVEPPRRRRNLRPSVLEAWRPAATTVRLAAATTTSGRVVDASGERAADATVAWTDDASCGFVDVEPDGSFVVPDSTSKEVELVATVGDGDPSLRGAPVKVPVGATDIRLPLLRGASLRLRVGATGRSHLVARIARGGSGPAWTLWRVPVENGTAVLRGLDADATYAVWVARHGPVAGAAEAVALLAGLRPRAEPHDVPWEPPSSIAVRLVVPAGVRVFDVSAVRGPLDVGRSNLDRGAPRSVVTLSDLPRGRFTVRVHGRNEAGDEVVGSADADAGGEVEVTLPSAPGR